LIILIVSVRVVIAQGTVTLSPTTSGTLYPNGGVKSISDGPSEATLDLDYGQFTFHWKYTGSAYISVSVTQDGGGGIVNGSTFRNDLRFDFKVTYTASGCSAATYHVDFYDKDAGGTGSATYTANVYCGSYYLTMLSSGSGSATPASGNQLGGSNVTITATPGVGCHSFDHWTGLGNGHYSGTLNPAQVQMLGAITETAVFNNYCTPTK